MGDLKLLHIDQLEDEPVNYSIGSSGQTLLRSDVLGNETWQYNFLLQTREYTADDLARMNNAEFTEQFVFYIHSCNNNNIFPDLPSGFTPIEIDADNGMILSIDDDGDRGIYQIQIHLVFEREVF